MKLSEWLTHAQNELEAAGIESARLEAQVLASHVLLVDRTWIIAHPDADFPELPGMNLLQRRLRREPLAYILGRREFYSREFLVGPGVLIPRQETETIIEAALELPQSDLRVLDIGTGSGCIAITLKLERPKWQVTASDLSPQALDVAKRNAEMLEAQIDFVQADGVAGILDRTFDVIVSNPPYVSREDPLSPEIRDFEPDLALYATGDGLDFYRRLSKECPKLLDRGGRILLELGDKQFESVCKIFQESGWKFVSKWLDLLGIVRVVAFVPQGGNKD